MSPVSITVLALGMSIDALLVSMGRGAALGTPRLSQALRTGLIFGTVEALAPLLGWAAGSAASPYVAAVDHWIAFVLLGVVGGRMMREGLRADRPARSAAVDGAFLVLVLMAAGTSLDAFAVGASLAFIDVNIVVIMLAIGTATLVMSTGGVLAGRIIGARFGSLAEMAGGAVLVVLGLSILLEHLLG